MLAIGRAMMAGAALMLDEPSLGLAPLIVREIFRIIPRLTAENTAVLLVEQERAHGTAVRGTRLRLTTGHVVLSGRAADLPRRAGGAARLSRRE
jgi:branched-chain amino acid transport system ATP-binding protein